MSAGLGLQASSTRGFPSSSPTTKIGIEEIFKKGNLWTLQQSTKPGASQEKLKGKHCKAALFKHINYWDYLKASLQISLYLKPNSTPDTKNAPTELVNK